MRTWLAAGRSKVDAITSPRIDRRMLVTSSGRSSTSSTTMSTFGLLWAIESASAWRRTVFPARGGEVMIPR